MRLDGFISAFMAAVSNCRLYSPEHPHVKDNIKRAVQHLEEFFKEADQLEIMVVEDVLVINRQPCRKKGSHVQSMIKRLKDRGITRLDIMPGVTEDELKEFVARLSSKHTPLSGTPHIKTGVVDINYAAAEEGSDSIGEYIKKANNEINEIYRQTGYFRNINVRGLEEIIVDFFLTVKKESALLRLIAPVSTYDEYTYTHATNVAVLSMFQAENLGFSGRRLHEIGIAGLLHDVGKLFISRDIIQKKGRLNTEEFRMVMKHPLYGAKYLSTIKGLTPVASIVAYEHHMRYDGSGYPPSVSRQHPASQIVAISDFFDALRTVRSYKQSLGLQETLSLMAKEAGRSFNPYLLDNFAVLLLKTLKGF